LDLRGGRTLFNDRWKPEVKTPPPSGPQKGKHADGTRSSNGLDQFFTSLLNRENLNLLDFAGASQANINYITNLGHRIYSDDILRSLEDAFGNGPDFLENQADPDRSAKFLRQSLDFPDAHFDAALVWDTLQFLSPSVLQETVDRLHRMLRPDAHVLAFFNAEEKLTSIPVQSYRILSSKEIVLVPRGERRPALFLNNRTLEKVFQKFSSIKFFLTRDHLREVIIKR